MKFIIEHKLYEYLHRPDIASVQKQRFMFSKDNSLSGKKKDFSYVWSNSSTIIGFYSQNGTYYIDIKGSNVDKHDTFKKKEDAIDLLVYMNLDISDIK